MTELKQQLASIYEEIKDTVRLNLEYAKLTGAEKSVSLLSVCALALLCIIIGSAVIFLISLGLVVLLSHSTGVFGACMIMAGIYLALLVLLITFRKQSIVNPVARFVSSLFLK